MFQNQIAVMVPKGIVEILEIINIEQGELHSLLRLVTTPRVLVKILLDKTSIPSPGQRITGGYQLQLAMCILKLVFGANIVFANECIAGDGQHGGRGRRDNQELHRPQRFSFEAPRHTEE